MINIVATVGPTLFKKGAIEKLVKEGVTFFRLNGAHGSIEYITEKIQELKKFNNINIVLDIPGCKIRTANLEEDIVFSKGETFWLKNHNVNYSKFNEIVRVNDIVFANDSIDRFEVVDISGEAVLFKTHTDGILRNNKGLHLKHECTKKLPFLFEKDIKLIQTAIDNEIDFVSLSYVKQPEDIQEVKKMISDNNSRVSIIAKLETSEAINNLESVLNENEYFLLDRGDISGELGILKIPVIQKNVIEVCNELNKKLFVATQIFISMTEKDVPNISEVNDVYNIIKTGVYGVQLSEETAIGKYPKECVEMIKNIEKGIKNDA